MVHRTLRAQAPEIQTETQGPLPPGTAERARAKIEALVQTVREPVLYARVRISSTANPAAERPYLAQAQLDVNGRAARARVTAPSATEAVDLLRDRLEQQLARLRRHWEARRGTEPLPGEWRHASLPTSRPDHFPRPPEEREIVRHKSYALARETPDEAVDEMELLDYDFHLFTDLETGLDSVVYRAGPTGYRVSRLEPDAPAHGPCAAPLTVSQAAVPRLTVAEAKRRLDADGRPFLFFRDWATGRGSLLYHRYDGHYGLVTPAV